MAQGDDLCFQALARLKAMGSRAPPQSNALTLLSLLLAHGAVGRLP
jgi:hypothetical protein